MISYVYVVCLGIACNYTFSTVGLMLAGTLSLGAFIVHPKLPPLPTLIPAVILALMATATGVHLSDRLLAVTMLLIFLAAYQLSVKALKVFGAMALIGAVSVIVMGHLKPNGGLYDVRNYNLATGAIVLSALLWRHKYQWLLIAVVLVALCFTGAAEALVVVGALLLTVLVRRDWNWKAMTVVGVFAIALTSLYFTTSIWHRTSVLLSDDTLGGRTAAYAVSVGSVELFGHGYWPTNLAYNSVHDVPLRVLYELGPIGLLCWLWLMVYGLWRTSWKYLFVAVAALALFDHLMWTQLGCLFWFACGLASQKTSDRDLIFARAEA